MHSLAYQGFYHLSKACFQINVAFHVGSPHQTGIHSLVHNYLSEAFYVVIFQLFFLALFSQAAFVLLSYFSKFCGLHLISTSLMLTWFWFGAWCHKANLRWARVRDIIWRSLTCDRWRFIKKNIQVTCSDLLLIIQHCFCSNSTRMCQKTPQIHLV